MKKFLLLMLALVLCVGLIACNPTTSEVESEPTSVESVESLPESKEESLPESEEESLPESEEESVPESEEESVVIVTYTVTFVQEGAENVVITVNEGEGIDASEIPTPTPVKGHTVTWDVSDFSAITSDITVTAVATPNVYTITYVVYVDGVAAPASQEITYGAEITLATIPTGMYEFKCWVTEDGEEFTAETYEIEGDLTLVAVFHNYTYPY